MKTWSRVILWALFFGTTVLPTAAAQQPMPEGKRAMTFMDVMEMRGVGSADISHDGQWLLYTISEPDWKENKNFTDIHLVSMNGGDSRQMTYTQEKNESSPEWSPRGGFFAFLSNREGKNQIYFMRPDGGEAWRVTDEKEGVQRFAFNKIGDALAYSAGKPEQRQIWILSLKDGPTETKPEQLTKHDTPVESWWWSPNGSEVYFTAPDRVDKADQQRKKKGFDVRIVDEEEPPNHLWVIGREKKEEQRLTEGNDYTVLQIEIAEDGRKLVFRGGSTDRYASRFVDSDLYLLDRASGSITRLTENDVGEGGFEFSPDSRWLAVTAPDEFQAFRQSELYVLPVGPQVGTLRKLTGDYDRAVSGFFWSADSRTLYFNSSHGVNNFFFSIPASGGNIEQLTDIEGYTFVSYDRDSGRVLIRHTNPSQPSDYYTAPLDEIGNRQRWVRLTWGNPQVEEFALGGYETVHWKSTDGTTVEGILVKPVGYREGTRYPLVVQIHGGPASAYTNSFSGSYGTYVHVFAANGYAVFQPNYRGSSSYGEKFRMEISGDYFRQAFDDIMTGVDFLIERGIADPDKLGHMGWSAGGHWSNWALVSTDRYKAISTGAGAVNWISLYAQTDVQFTREFYFQGTPYDNWDHYLEVSPLKYIKNAKTPTLIHFGEKDQRIPMPQGQELHMALKKLGVPTEFIVYPNMPHGLRNDRYQMVKMQAEFAWFEKWIKGKEGWIDWQALLDTLQDKEEEEKKEKAEKEDN